MVAEAVLAYSHHAANLTMKGVTTMNGDTPAEPTNSDAGAQEAPKADKPEVAVEPKEESAVAPEPQPIAVKEETPAPAPAPEPAKPAVSAAVTKAGVDAVHLSACVYKNMRARKSLTVHHLQRRLYELGYKEAYADKDGWYGDLTKSAVASFQKDKGIAGNVDPGIADLATLQAIFAGDPNVYVTE